MRKIFIPQNNHGIHEGYYTINKIVNILRSKNNDPKTAFVLDMLEV